MGRTKEVNFLTFVEDVPARKARPRMRRDEANIELPSWIADLRWCLDPPSMWDYSQHVEEFSISRGLGGSSGIQVLEDQRRLRMQGYQFDSIKQYGETNAEARERRVVPGSLPFLSAIFRSAETPYGTQEQALDAIWSSMASFTDSNMEPRFPVPELLKNRVMLWLCDAMASAKVFRDDNPSVQEQTRLLS